MTILKNEYNNCNKQERENNVRLQYYYTILGKEFPNYTYSIGFGIVEPSYYKNVSLYRYLLNPYYNATIDNVSFENYFF